MGGGPRFHGEKAKTNGHILIRPQLLSFENILRFDHEVKWMSVQLHHLERGGGP